MHRYQLATTRVREIEVVRMNPWFSSRFITGLIRCHTVS